MSKKAFILEQAKLNKTDKKHFDKSVTFNYTNVLGWDYEIQDWHTLYLGLYFLDYFKLEKEQCIDVGGLKGLFSSIYARHFKSVHTFEPNPYANAICKMNFDRQELPNVTLHKVALYDEQKEVNFYMKFFDEHFNSITGQSNTEIEVIQEDGLFTQVIKVKTSCLDDFNFSPSFLKIDAEGANLNIIKGGIKTIKDHKPFIQVENDAIRENNPLVEKILLEIGYEKINMNNFKHIYDGAEPLSDDYFIFA